MNVIRNIGEWLKNAAIGITILVSGYFALGSTYNHGHGAGMVEGWNMAVENCIRDRTKCTKTERAPE